MDDGGDELAAQQSLMPDVQRDPPMWLVKCRPGKEKEIVLGIMSKFVARQNTADPLVVISAVAPDHLKVMRE